jgi:hypothetical protein
MSTDKWKDISPIEIPISLLIYSQQNLSELPLEEGHSYCGDEFVHVVHYQGGFFLVDGHNRVDRLKKNRHIFVKARLLFKI